jgi:uncharacterized protein (TIGR00645 family)
MANPQNLQPKWLTAAEKPIFASRWLQAPMYFGLIIAQLVYVYKFMVELGHLIFNAQSMKETEVLLMVLGLVDVVMVANLLIMVIVGGYETFVSKLYLQGHPDRPEWLDHVNAGVLKVKLAAAMVTISSIHLLKTFINVENITGEAVIFQIVIHLVFVVSTLLMVLAEKLMKGVEKH